MGDSLVGVHCGMNVCGIFDAEVEAVKERVRDPKSALFC